MAVTGKAEVRIWGSFFLQNLWEYCLGMAVADFMINHNVMRMSISVLVAVAFGELGISALAFVGGEVYTVFNDIPALFGYGAFALIIYIRVQ